MKMVELLDANISSMALESSLMLRDRSNTSAGSSSLKSKTLRLGASRISVLLQEVYVREAAG